MEANQNKETPTALLLVSLILAGEAIFFLPFILPRVFRPTLLEVFEINNVQLGSFFSVYGTIAMVSYLFGGPIADRFRPHKLMSLALWLTALGAVSMFFIPDPFTMRILYGFWGFSTIFLFWSALMRTTRIVGGEGKQGMAFGILDGGRGLFAALTATLLVYLFSRLIPLQSEDMTSIERREAFRWVIIGMGSIVFLVGLLVRFSLKKLSQSKELYTKVNFQRLKEVARMPAVWLQALIIICAYSGYKVTDDFSLLARDVLDYDEVKSAGFGTMSLYLRPVAAIGAGLLADRFKASSMIFVCFALMITGGFLVFFFSGDVIIPSAIIVAIVSTALAVYAMRGLYFAIMGEAGIPIGVTGTVVGLASIIGYLPDIYMGPLMGYYLDTFPGVQGHRYVFVIMACFALTGLISILFFRRFLRQS